MRQSENPLHVYHYNSHFYTSPKLYLKKNIQNSL